MAPLGIRDRCIRAVTLTMLGIMAASPAGSQAPAEAQTPAGAQTPAAADAGIAPFSAHYQADWKSISVGTSDLELKNDSQPGHYVYTWTITAHGIFRTVYRDDLIQKSWFSINAGHARPSRYRAEDGSSSVDLDFDWAGGHVRGTSEKKPVDLELKEGTQDVMSIQVEVMLDLQQGNLPNTFQIIDKDELKDFIYTQEGTANIRTDLGRLDTIIVSSQRAGNDRILRMWFAPALGFVPVQAERTRGGKLEFAMRIKTLKR
jgi:Protein of unknown function (DUF3108)